jgi:hypothetical protein
MRPFLLAIMFALYIASPAMADTLAVANLQQLCTSSDSKAKGECGFYILGIFEGAMTQANTTGGKKPFCVPENVTMDQMRDTVTDYIKGHLATNPEDSGKLAVIFVGMAMMRAFPCAKTN